MAWKQACVLLSFTMLFISSSEVESRSLQSDWRFSSQSTMQVNSEKGANLPSKLFNLDFNATSSVADRIVEMNAGSDYHDCYIVCCWQADASCPYPYCNYNDAPCNGQ